MRAEPKPQRQADRAEDEPGGERKDKTPHPAMLSKAAGDFEPNRLVREMDIEPEHQDRADDREDEAGGMEK
jgi:hypothetical protein